MVKFEPIVITLKNREDRIDAIKNFYGNIPLFYGESKDELKKHKQLLTTPLCNYFCTIPMVGCASSHISLWKKIATRTEGLFMIIEDDTFINLNTIDTLVSDIENKFKETPNMFLQIVGEGLSHHYTEYYKSLILDKYSYHFFLGCYMITPYVAKILYNHFRTFKISYHIDLSLNSVEGLDMRILRNNNLGRQAGLTDSNMKEAGKSKLFRAENNEHLYYALNFPICSVFDMVITFTTIFLFLLLVLAFYYKNCFMFFFYRSRSIRGSQALRSVFLLVNAEILFVTFV